MKTPKDFLERFKKVEARLKAISRTSGDNAQFKDLMKNAIKYSPVIQQKSNELWNLYGLRNVFSHGDRDQYIAEINQIAFEQLDRILDLIDNPPTVGEVFARTVYVASSEDITEVVLREMQTKLYTHVPVYQEEKFIGLLTETTLLDWLLENIKEGKADFYKRLVRHINKSFLHSKSNKFIFVSAATSIFDVYQEFQNAIEGDSRLGAILITKSGKKDEKLLGIITAWDLPKIQDYLK